MSINHPSLQEVKARAIREGARDPMRVVASVALAICHGHEPPNEIFAQLRKHQPGLFRQ